jgi:hypothetical protein
MDLVAINIDPTNDKLYYNSKELQECKPDFYHHCKKNKNRDIVNIKKIPESEYVYAYLKKSGWILSNVQLNRATLFISKEWCDIHCFKTVKPKLNIMDDEEEEEIELAPPILKLKKSEKYACDGNIFEMETRGVREHDGIYFRLKCIIKAFKLPKLQDMITNNDSGFQKNIHYKYFIVETNPMIPGICLNDLPLKKSKKTTKGDYFFTYLGLTRLLFVSRGEHALQFQSWAIKILFVHQMGSDDQKMKLGTDLLNIPVETYVAVFKKSASVLPVIYLFYLGTVGQLRETFGIDPSIPDDAGVYKFGCSKNFAVRLPQLERDYDLPNVDFQLKTFHTIDVKHKHDAEREVKNLCEGFDVRLAAKGYNELVVLNKLQLETVNRQYAYIGAKYVGATEEIQRQLAEMKIALKDSENEVAYLKVSHKNELLEKDLVIQQEANELKLLKIQMEHDQLVFGLEKQNSALQIQLLTKTE